MKTIQLQWSRLLLAFLFAGLLASYLPYPGLPDLPATLSKMLRDSQPRYLSQH